jgi:flagellar basal-body rod modification protein FlgD
MTVAAISAATQPLANQQPARLTSDFDTFLKMLTVQIQNQDPMNPMQSTEFAAQLATFSGVEQQVRTNQQLADLSRTLSVSTMAELSGWIGMEARVDAPVDYTGTPITLSTEAPPLADDGTLIIRDARGAEVARTPLLPGANPLIWNGLDAFGAPLPPGRYQFQAEFFAKGDSLGIQKVEHYALVREARGSGTGDILLVVGNGITVPATSASALRQPNGV